MLHSAHNNPNPLGYRPTGTGERALLPEEIEILRRLEAWPLDFLKGRLGQNSLFESTDVDRYLLEYKRFMFFKGRSDALCGMYSPRVDAVWHQHILYTRQYAAFCHTIFGRFVHHVPSDLMEGENFKTVAAWLFQYVRMFPDYPPDLPRELNGSWDCA